MIFPGDRHFVSDKLYAFFVQIALLVMFFWGFHYANCCGMIGSMLLL